MKISRDTIIKNIGSFILVFIIFGGGWYYLDQQRLESFKIKEEAIKLKADTDAKEKYIKQLEADLSTKQNQLAKIETDLIERENQLNEREKQLNYDSELNQLTLKFVDELAHVNLFEKCGDDEEHNAKVRKAEALLNLIEAKAKQYKRTEIMEVFVQKCRQGIFLWKAKCKP